MFGGFRLERVLGQGAMGRVYLAQSQSGQRLALKVLLESPEDEEASQRFVREGLAMAAVPRHPNVLGVVTAGQDRGLLFLAIELATGGDLEEELKAAGRLAPGAALDVAEALASALDHVHQAGIVHRDLKPANAIRREDGTLALADFGLAKVNSLERLTQTGEMLGTPLYMAPEQVMGEKDLDGRADVWALGVILYRALSGQLPFQGATATQTMQQILEDEPAPLAKHCPELGLGYQELVSRALSKEREDRFQTGAEFREAIQGCRDRAGGQSEAGVEARLKRVLLILSLVAVVLVGASVAAWIVTQRRQRAEYALRLEEIGAAGRALGGDLLARSAPPQPGAIEELEEAAALLAEHPGAEGVDEKAAIQRELRLAALRARWRLAVSRKDWAAAEELTSREEIPEPDAVLMRQSARVARGQAVDLETLERLAGGPPGEASRGARILLAGVVAEGDSARGLELLSGLHEDPVARPELNWVQTLVATDPFDLAPILRCAPHLSAAQRAVVRPRVLALLEPLTIPVENQDEVMEMAPAERPQWDHPRATALLRALGALGSERIDRSVTPPPEEGALLRALLLRIQQSIQARNDIKNIQGWRDLLTALGRSQLRTDSRTRPPVLWPLVTENAKKLPVDALLDYRMTVVMLDIPVDTADLSLRGGPFAKLEEIVPGIETPLAEFVTLRLRLLDGDAGEGRPHLTRLVELLEKTPPVVGPYCRADALAFLGACFSLSLEEREAYVAEALALDPKSPWVRVSRALCLAERGRVEEAREEELAAFQAHLSEQTIQRTPDSFFVRRSGLVYSALGEPEQANRRFRGIKFPGLPDRVQGEAEDLLKRYGRALRKKQEKR